EQQGVLGRLQLEAAGDVVVDLGLVVGEEHRRMGHDELETGTIILAVVEAAQHRERTGLVAEADEDEAAGVGEPRQATGEVQLGEVFLGAHRRKSTREGWMARAVAPRAAW